MTGIMAAELASLGYTGIPGIAGLEEYRKRAGDIGERYLLEEGIVWKDKNYAFCGWAHAAIKGAGRLVREHGLRLEEITRIRVEGFHEAEQETVPAHVRPGADGQPSPGASPSPHVAPRKDPGVDGQHPYLIRLEVWGVPDPDISECPKRMGPPGFAGVRPQRSVQEIDEPG